MSPRSWTGAARAGLPQPVELVETYIPGRDADLARARRAPGPHAGDVADQYRHPAGTQQLDTAGERRMSRLRVVEAGNRDDRQSAAGRLGDQTECERVADAQGPLVDGV